METNKEKAIVIRVNEEEMSVIKAKANLAGLKVSEYLRRLGKEQSVAARLSSEDRKNLVGIGRNLNQLTAYAHKGHIYHDQINLLIERLKQILMK